MALEWHYDPAAVRPRYRAWVDEQHGGGELFVCENGMWMVSVPAGRPYAATGMEPTMTLAKERVIMVHAALTKRLTEPESRGDADE